MSVKTYKMYCRGMPGMPEVTSTFPTAFGDERAILMAKERSEMIGKDGTFTRFLVCDITDGLKNAKTLAAWELVQKTEIRDLP